MNSSISILLFQEQFFKHSSNAAHYFHKFFDQLFCKTLKLWLKILSNSFVEKKIQSFNRFNLISILQEQFFKRHTLHRLRVHQRQQGLQPDQRPRPRQRPLRLPLDPGYPTIVIYLHQVCHFKTTVWHGCIFGQSQAIWDWKFHDKYLHLHQLEPPFSDHNI